MKIGHRLRSEITFSYSRCFRRGRRIVVVLCALLIVGASFGQEPDPTTMTPEQLWDQMVHSATPSFIFSRTLAALEPDDTKPHIYFGNEVVIDKDSQLYKSGVVSGAVSDDPVPVPVFVNRVDVVAPASIDVPPLALVLFITNRLIIEPSARLQFKGGSVLVCASAVSVDSVDIGAAGDDYLKQFDTKGRATESFQEKGESALTTMDVPILDFSSCHGLFHSDNDELILKRSMSAGFLRMYQYVVTELQTAYISKSREDMLRALRDSSFLPAVLPDRPFLTELSAERDKIIQLLPAVYEYDLPVNIGAGASRTAMLFMERQSAENRLAPTDALVAPRIVDGRSVLGFVRQSPTNADRVQIAFDARLTVDPLIAGEASKELGWNGQTLKDTFVNWTLSQPRLIGQGVARYDVKVSGDTLQATIDLGNADGNVALWRLGTEAGLPLTMEYMCNADHNVHGEVPFRVSLVKRTSNDLEVNLGMVKNSGRTAVTINYLLLDDKPIQLNPGLVVLGNGREVALPVPAGTNLTAARIRIPPEAVVFTGRDPVSLDDFDISETGGLVQKVQIHNLLAFNEKLKLNVEFVEVVVHYTVGSGDMTTTMDAGPYKLAPRGADGSEIAVPFIKPKNGQFMFSVAGTAYYDKGRSTLSLRSIPSSDLAINITEEMLGQK